MFAPAVERAIREAALLDFLRTVDTPALSETVRAGMQENRDQAEGSSWQEGALFALLNIAGLVSHRRDTQEGKKKREATAERMIRAVY
jgi:hypothetical protein